jgi:hypothetical protein
MLEKTPYQLEEPFLLHELFLGMAIAIGMLLTVIVDVLGMVTVLLGVVAVAWIYVYRIVNTYKERERIVICCFSWLNNGVMILAGAGILMLMLMNAFHRPVFYTSLGLLGAVLMANGIFLRYNIRGFMHITAQLRLLIALVILLVFFLL